MERRLISIVSPVYNERENVERLLAEIQAFFGGELSDQFAWEVLFVDDGSTDGSTEILKRFSREHDNVRVVVLSRNFGHQAAVSAGYHYASGDAVVTMDSDLQHPVALVGEMLSRWRDGYDVVYAVRDCSHGGLLKKMCSHGFYRVFNSLSPTKILPGGADFRLVTRSVVDALNQMPERCRFLRGMIPWLGFRSIEIPYTPRPRAAGEPKYNFFRSLGLGITALTSFSLAPLRGALLLGALFMLISIIYLTYCLIDWLSGGSVVQGWPSIVALIVLTQGMMLLAFGIQAEYLARIVMEVKNRPEYVVREVIGGAATSESKQSKTQSGTAEGPDTKLNGRD
jgi:polyisoprenyl-phosphate glycosyltransferase